MTGTYPTPGEELLVPKAIRWHGVVQGHIGILPTHFYMWQLVGCSTIKESRRLVEGNTRFRDAGNTAAHSRPPIAVEHYRRAIHSNTPLLPFEETKMFEDMLEVVTAEP